MEFPAAKFAAGTRSRRGDSPEQERVRETRRPAMEMTMRRSGKRVVIVIRLDDGTTITIDIPP